MRFREVFTRYLQALLRISLVANIVAVFSVTAAMLTLVHREKDYSAFAALVRLRYCSVLPLIILGALFLDQFGKEDVRRTFHGNVIPVTISSC